MFHTGALVKYRYTAGEVAVWDCAHDSLDSRRASPSWFGRAGDVMLVLYNQHLDDGTTSLVFHARGTGWISDAKLRNADDG